MHTFVSISGPTNAGKSSCARIVAARLNSIEIRTKIIHLDDYFVAAKSMPRWGTWRNWEHPGNIQFSVLIYNVLALKQGKQTKLLSYVNGKSSLGESIGMDYHVYIIEGFLALYNEELNKLMDLKVYLDASLSVIRERRREKDKKIEKGYFDQVIVPSIKEHVAPQKQLADLVIPEHMSVADKVSEIYRQISLKLQS